MSDPLSIIASKCYQRFIIYFSFFFFFSFYSAFIVVKNSKVFILFIDFDEYVRAVEGETTTIACTGGNVIVFERITYGDNYRIELQSCSDPNAAQALAPYCQFKQTCTVTIDRTLFTASTCAASITEYFQARYFCRPRKFIE